jgi:hypothetical protein
MWMRGGCKVYMDSYMASNGSCFMVTWIIFKSHLLDVGLTQNRELHGSERWQPLIYSIYHAWGPAWIYKVIEIAFGWGPSHIWLHTTLEGLWPHYMILEVYWDGLWTLSVGLSQFHGHGSWLVCDHALGATSNTRLSAHDHCTSLLESKYTLILSVLCHVVYTILFMNIGPSKS